MYGHSLQKLNRTFPLLFFLFKFFLLFFCISFFLFLYQYFSNLNTNITIFIQKSIFIMNEFKVILLTYKVRKRGLEQCFRPKHAFWSKHCSLLFFFFVFGSGARIPTRASSKVFFSFPKHFFFLFTFFFLQKWALFGGFWANFVGAFQQILRGFFFTNSYSLSNFFNFFF